MLILIFDTIYAHFPNTSFDCRVPIWNDQQLIYWFVLWITWFQLFQIDCYFMLYVTNYRLCRLTLYLMITGLYTLTAMWLFVSGWNEWNSQCCLSRKIVSIVGQIWAVRWQKSTHGQKSGPEKTVTQSKLHLEYASWIDASRIQGSSASDSPSRTSLSPLAILSAVSGHGSCGEASPLHRIDRSDMHWSNHLVMNYMHHACLRGKPDNNNNTRLECTWGAESQSLVQELVYPQMVPVHMPKA